MTGRPRMVLGAVVALALVLPAAPLALRKIPFFRVRQVELIGVRYLSPDTVLATLALAPGHTVFHDLDAAAGRVAALEGIESARLGRKLPGTLRVVVTERVPVAFVSRSGRLVAVDGEGRRLPFDPAASVLDLPLVPGDDSLLVRALSAVRFADSALFRELDGARKGPRGGIRLELGGERLLLSDHPGADDIRALGAVRQHLQEDGRRYRELDARFRGWVVVRRGLS